jgi:hypothetical protein
MLCKKGVSNRAALKYAPVRTAGDASGRQSTRSVGFAHLPISPQRSCRSFVLFSGVSQLGKMRKRKLGLPKNFHFKRLHTVFPRRTAVGNDAEK